MSKNEHIIVESEIGEGSIKILVSNIRSRGQQIWSLGLAKPNLSDDKCKELAGIIEDFLKQKSE